jgi:hypothetical protein
MQRGSVNMGKRPAHKQSWTANQKTEHSFRFEESGVRIGGFIKPSTIGEMIP